MKVGSARKELMNFWQGGCSPLWPGRKSLGDRLSRMLGSGLAATLVLELVGLPEPTAMEKVVVTDPLADVFVEDLEDSVLVSGSSVVARL